MLIPHHFPTLKEKLFFFISGVVISIPFSIFIESLSSQLLIGLPLFFTEVVSVAILTPFIEEFAKAYPLFYRHGENQSSIFTLGFITGLGFGVTEFLVYVFLAGVPFYFRLPAVIFHAATTSIVAYGIATRRSLRFYLTAVSLHLMNNLLSVMDASIFAIMGWVALLALTYMLSWRLYLRVLHKPAKELN
jgi:RsiW-degrading membrane proteinase PrsW (M82 family)